jgi:hypothetical protein
MEDIHVPVCVVADEIGRCGRESKKIGALRNPANESSTICLSRKEAGGAFGWIVQNRDGGEVLAHQEHEIVRDEEFSTKEIRNCRVGHTRILGPGGPLLRPRKRHRVYSLIGARQVHHHNARSHFLEQGRVWKN